MHFLSIRNTVTTRKKKKKLFEGEKPRTEKRRGFYSINIYVIINSKYYNNLFALSISLCLFSSLLSAAAAANLISLFVRGGSGCA